MMLSDIHAASSDPSPRDCMLHVTCGYFSLLSCCAGSQVVRAGFPASESPQPCMAAIFKALETLYSKLLQNELIQNQ